MASIFSFASKPDEPRCYRYEQENEEEGCALNRIYQNGPKDEYY